MFCWVVECCVGGVCVFVGDFVEGECVVVVGCDVDFYCYVVEVE